MLTDRSGDEHLEMTLSTKIITSILLSTPGTPGTIQSVSKQRLHLMLTLPIFSGTILYYGLMTLSRYNLEGQNQIQNIKRLRDYNAVFQLIQKCKLKLREV